MVMLQIYLQGAANTIQTVFLQLQKFSGTFKRTIKRNFRGTDSIGVRRTVQNTFVELGIMGNESFRAF